MILVLQGADFSANNLGQVEITTELAEFTKAAIAASGNSTMNEKQKSALNTFFRKVGAFGSTGVWSKIHYAWIPIIGGSLDKAFMNYKNNEVNVVPKSDYWTMVDGGVKSIQGGVGGRTNFKSSDVVYGNNFSVATTYINGEGSNAVLASFGEDYYEIFITGSISGGGDVQLSIQKHDGTSLGTVTSTGVSDNPRILSVNGSNISAVINGSKMTAVASEEIVFKTADTGDLLIEPLSYLVKGANAPTDTGVSIMFIGEALSDSEMMLLNEAMQEFKKSYLE